MAVIGIMSTAALKRYLSGSRDELKASLQLAWKIVVMVFMKKSVDLITYVFLGHLEKRYLAAAGLANVTANVVGNSIVTGLVGALATICAQAHGARNYDILNATLQRGVIILLLACVPLTILWICSEPIIVALGQSQDIALLASTYLFYLIPGLFSFAYTVCLQGWLNAQQLTEATATIGVITAVLHPLWCYVLMYTLCLGYVGAAIALSLTRVLEGALLTFYVMMFYQFRSPFVFLAPAVFQHWSQFLRLGLPNVLMNSQWWAEEVIIFLSGTFSHPEQELAAMSVYQYMISICYILPRSLATVGSCRVGHFLGEGDAPRAKVASLVSPILSLLQSVGVSMLLIGFRRDVAYIFTNDQGVNKMVGESLIYVLAVYVVADSVQGALTGVLSGMGRQGIAGPVVFFCYYLIGLPTAYMLASTKHGMGLGVLGLTLGVAVGTWIHAAVYIVILQRTDWSQEVQRAQSQTASTSGGASVTNKRGEIAVYEMVSQQTDTDSAADINTDSSSTTGIDVIHETEKENDIELSDMV